MQVIFFIDNFSIEYLFILNELCKKINNLKFNIMKTLKELFTGKKANEEHGHMKSHHEDQSPKREHHGHCNV